MGKKAGKHDTDAAPEKKGKGKGKEKDRLKVGGSRRAGAAGEPLMLAVERCPPDGRLLYEWVVGNGLGVEAVAAAQAAYDRAFDVRLAALEARARTPAAGDCGKGCVTHRRSLFGPVFGPQSWQIDTDAEPARATTWSWVGFFTLTDCTCV